MNAWWCCCLVDGTNVSITINNYLKLHSQLTPHVSSPTTASSGLSSSFGEDLCRPYKTLLILAAGKVTIVVMESTCNVC